MRSRSAWTLRLLLPAMGVLIGFAGTRLVSRPAETAVSASFREALKRPDVSKNRQLILQTFASLDEQNARAIGAVLEESIDQLNYCTYLPMVDRWLDVDSIGARESLSRWSHASKIARARGEIVYNKALAGEFDEAQALISTYHSSPDWKEVAGPYLAGLAEREDATQTIADFLVASSQEKGRLDIAALATSHLSRSQGIESAQTLASELAKRSEGEIAAASFNEVVRQRASRDPAEAAKWLESGEHDQSNTASRKLLVEQWTERAPEAALAWALSLPSTEQSPVIASALARWLDKDPESASNWAVESLPESTYPATLRFLVRRFRLEAPPVAANWAARHPDQAIRHSLLLSVLRPWWKTNVLQANRWLESANLPEVSMQKLERARSNLMKASSNKRERTDNPEAKE